MRGRRRFILQLVSLVSSLLVVSLVSADPGPEHITGRTPGVKPPTSRSVEAVLASSVAGTAFAVELYPDEGLYYIPDISSPGDWLDFGDTTGTAYFAGDFVGGDYSRLFVIDYYLNELHALNTATGADTTIGSCVPLSGQVWTGATGTDDGTLYASSTDETSSYLYTVNPATGAATVVGQITNALDVIDLAISPDGEMYGVDILTDSLIQIDPATGAGTVIGSLGFDANAAQGMDFEVSSGLLYLAAFNWTEMRGELRVADTATGSTTLVDTFSGGAEVGVFAFTPPASQAIANPGFESGLTSWQTEGTPFLSSNSHTGSASVQMGDQESWVWQLAFIPSDVIDVRLGYWLSGISSDPEWDNDIFCGGIWDLTRQTEYVSACRGMAYYYSYPGTWRQRLHGFNASELAAVAGKPVLIGFRLTQDWNPGFHKTSTAYVDDTILYITRPFYDYDYAVYLPLVIR